MKKLKQQQNPKQEDIKIIEDELYKAYKLAKIEMKKKEIVIDIPEEESEMSEEIPEY